jgi:hypothetical protein
MPEKTKVETALGELVSAVREEGEGVAEILEAACARLDQLAVTVAPLDRRLAEACRGARSSLEQHTPGLRNAVQGFESRMLPGEPADVLPFDRGLSA